MVNFNKASEIRQGVDETTNKYNIYYGLDQQRIKSVYTDENNITKIRYYFGNYERTIKNNVIEEVDYITTPAGITAMRIYNDVEGLEKLYYLHTDNLGSIQAITNESKSIVASYYYTPWGGRVALVSPPVGDLGGFDRGYTFHEHLTEFGLINMNGRVYDPVLARFLSPDPYIQAPDYTQNFNRYSYCYNNPFKYTDPSGELQIGPFYASLNVGYSSGGFSIGISAGVGIENMASAGISIGYNTSGSFTFSANAGVAGFYANAGYDTKGGFFAGAGWSAPLPSFGIVSFNTNLTSFGVNYSQNGGLSGNYMGVQISRDGTSFSPSVGVGMTLKWGTEVYASKYQTSSENGNDEETFPFLDENEFNEWVDNNINRDDFGVDETLAFNTLNYDSGGKKYFRGNDGSLYMIDKKTYAYEEIGGVTVVKYNGWGKNSDIYISRRYGCYNLTAVFNHELIHAYHVSIGLRHILGRNYNDYTESIAYQYYYDNGFRSSGVIWGVNNYPLTVYKTILPPYLIPLPK